MAIFNLDIIMFMSYQNIHEVIYSLSADISIYFDAMILINNVFKDDHQ